MAAAAAEEEEAEEEEEEKAEESSLVGLVDDCLPDDDDDDLLRFLDDTSVSNRGAEQEGGKEEEEEEEELEWLSNSDAFPMLDPSVSFGPVTASVGSVTLEGLETVIKELENHNNQEFGKLDTDTETEEKVIIPKKRRSDVRRRPREVLFPIPSLLGDGRRNGNEERVSVRRCTHCRVKETPQWRQGPAGPGTLCNACGVRYKSGRLYDEYRPANSPTFSPGRHSNFHRKVIEMRVEKQTDGVVSSLKKVGQSGQLGPSGFDGREQG